jgi:nitrite reductase/ring-hydroxylating ferredoxin subunit
MDRRRWIQLASSGALGLAGGATGLWALGANRRRPLPVMLGPLEDFPPGSARIIEAHGVLVQHGPGGLAFISTRCTHLGCRVRLAGEELRCPCHRGRFDLTGALLGGPPSRPLPWLQGGVTSTGEVFLLVGSDNAGRRRWPVAGSSPRGRGGPR